MPVPALPIPHASQPSDLTELRREFRDLLQRPLTGNITVVGSDNHRTGELTVPGMPVKVTLTEGVLSIKVPAGEYRLYGKLWNKDDETVAIDETVTVGEEA